MSSSHDITLTPQEQALIMRLKSFRVPEMAHILEEQLKDPNADLNTFMERMTAMVDAEWQARADKRFNRLMKEAHLRYPAADLDETIYRPERQLDTCLFHFAHKSVRFYILYTLRLLHCSYTKSID